MGVLVKVYTQTTHSNIQCLQGLQWTVSSLLLLMYHNIILLEISLPSKISPLPSLTSKFLHSYFYLTHMTLYPYHLDDSSTSLVSSFCYISWPKHRSELKNFIDSNQAVSLDYDHGRWLVT